MAAPQVTEQFAAAANRCAKDRGSAPRRFPMVFVSRRRDLHFQVVQVRPVWQATVKFDSQVHDARMEWQKLSETYTHRWARLTGSAGTARVTVAALMRKVDRDKDRESFKECTGRSHGRQDSSPWNPWAAELKPLSRQSHW